MPNPLFLKVLGVSLSEYNSYSPAKKERFQKVATQKLAELHEGDIDAYCELTEAVATESASAEIENTEQTEVTEEEFSKTSKRRRKQTEEGV